MKLVIGAALGFIGYCTWKLTEPEPGESGDWQARRLRLKKEWDEAVRLGKSVGDYKRQEMEREFEAIFERPKPA